MSYSKTYTLCLFTWLHPSDQHEMLGEDTGAHKDMGKPWGSGGLGVQITEDTAHDMSGAHHQFSKYQLKISEASPEQLDHVSPPMHVHLVVIQHYRTFPTNKLEIKVTRKQAGTSFQYQLGLHKISPLRMSHAITSAKNQHFPSTHPKCAAANSSVCNRLEV